MSTEHTPQLFPTFDSRIVPHDEGRARLAEIIAKIVAMPDPDEPGEWRKIERAQRSAVKGDA